MTSLFSILRPKWKTACLALVLICQAVQGYPRRESSPVDPASSVAHDVRSNVSLLIETAYENHELVRPKEWVQDDDFLQREKRCQNVSMIQGSASSRPEQGQRKMLSNRRQGLAIGSSSQSDGTFVFPTDERMVHQTQRIDLGSVPSCQGATFCVDVAYYPSNLVNQAIGQNDSLKYLASVDVVSNIVQRIDGPDERPLCLSEEQIVYPQSAENKRKEWLFVVNQDNFKQGVRIEICNDELHRCNVIDGFSEGYQTSCKQKYIYRQLAAVGNDGNVVSDAFRFPSSCCCHLRFTGNPLSRIGIDERSNQTTAPSRKRK